MICDRLFDDLDLLVLRTMDEGVPLVEILEVIKEYIEIAEDEGYSKEFEDYLYG